MTEQHDFKGALEECPAYQYDIGGFAWGGDEAADWLDDNYETIQYALNLADKMQSGEVSEEALNIFHRVVRIEVIVDKKEANIINDIEAFKAMSQQMMKEIEDER